MRAHCENAQALAEWLETHPAIEKVVYPGLASHPQHALAARQMDGFGGIVSIWIKGGFDAARRFCERTELFTLAESLGGVESLVNHPAVMTHASVPVGASQEPRHRRQPGAPERGRRGASGPSPGHRGGIVVRTRVTAGQGRQQT